MIRLVTQFDPPGRHAAVATPTCCGGCCCCCCCVVTAIGASVVAAVDAQRLHRRAKAAPEPPPTWGSPWPAVVGALALPIAIGIFVLAAAADASTGALAVGFAVWLGVSGAAYRGAGYHAPWLRALALAGIGSVALVIEFLVWISLFVDS